MAKRPSPEDLVRYVRNYILEQKASGKTWSAIGAPLGLGHSRVIQIANPEKYGDARVSHDVLAALADELHDGSLDRLYEAAAKWVTKQAARSADAANGTAANTLALARLAAKEIARVEHVQLLDVWPDFLHPIPKYQGPEPRTVDDMVREYGKITRQRLGLEPPDAIADHPVLSDEPGPPSDRPPGGGHRRRPGGQAVDEYGVSASTDPTLDHFAASLEEEEEPHQRKRPRSKAKRLRAPKSTR